MKKRLLFLFLVLCSVCLWGCTSRAPYLSAQERETIDRGILDTVAFEKSENNTTVSFTNSSKYALTDFRISSLADGKIVLYQKIVPPNTEVRVNYNPADPAAPGSRCGLVYTIGDYSYHSEQEFPLTYTTPSEEPGMDILAVMLETSNGLLPLDYDEPISFMTGSEINGLKKTRINSIATEFTFYNYNNKCTLVLDCSGKRPSKSYSTNVICKLINEQGIVTDCQTLLFLQNNEAKLYLFDIEPGTYTLRFIETE